MSRTEVGASSASLWAIIGYGTAQVLRLLGNLILARLLLPDAFGMMALLSILMQGLTMFSDVGIGASIIRSERVDDPNFINTAWTIQVIRGIGLWLGACLLAIPFAQFYDEPAFNLLVPVLGLSALFAGLNSTAIFVENRALRLKRVIFLELSSHFCSLVVMVVWAYHVPSVWALVGGGVFAAVLKCGLSHLIFPSAKNRFDWNPVVAREIIGFGKWIILSSALTFTSLQIDRLVVGKLVSLKTLGVYHIGWMWAQVPALLFQVWSERVFFPAAARRMRSSASASLDDIVNFRRKILISCTPLLAGLIVGISEFIDFFYLPIYSAAGSIAMILLVGVWIKILGQMNSAVLLAAGQPKWLAFGNALTVLVFLLLVFPFFKVWGVAGIAIAVTCAQFGYYLPCAVGATKVGYGNFLGDIQLTLFVGGFWIAFDQLAIQTEQRIGSGILELLTIFGIPGLIGAGIAVYFWIRTNRAQG